MNTTTARSYFPAPMTSTAAWEECHRRSSQNEQVSSEEWNAAATLLAADMIGSDMPGAAEFYRSRVQDALQNAERVAAGRSYPLFR